MRYALVYSCNQYKDDKYEELKWPENDIEELANILINDYDFNRENVQDETLNIYNTKKPSDIFEDIKRRISDSEEGDTILFYFSGHGDIENDDSYIVLPNTDNSDLKGTALLIDDLVNLLSVNNRMNIILLDTCHSGQPGLLKKYYGSNNILKEGTGTFVLAACDQKKISNEDDNLKHGVFTYNLLESLREFKVDDNVYPEILKLKVTEKVDKWKSKDGEKQNVIMSCFTKGNASIAIRKKGVNKADIVEFIKNTEFLDRTHMLQKISELKNKRAKIGKIKYRNKDYDAESNNFNFTLEENSLINILNSKIRNIVNLNDTLLYFKAKQGIARNIYEDQRELELFGEINIEDEFIVFDNLELKDRKGHKFDIGGIYNSEAKAIYESKDKILDFEYVDENTIIVVKEKEIQYYNLKTQKSMNEINILNDEEKFNDVEICRGKDTIIMLADINNDECERQVHVIEDGIITKKEINENNTDVLYNLKSFDTFNKIKSIAYIINKQFGYINIENNDNFSCSFKNGEDIKVNPDDKYIMIYSKKNLQIRQINDLEKVIFERESYLKIERAIWIDNKNIAICYVNKQIIIIDIEEKKEKKEIKCTFHNVSLVKVIPNSNFLCVGGDYKLGFNTHYRINIFSINNNRESFLKGYTGELFKISPKGESIAAINNNSIVIWRILNPQISV